MTIPEAMSRLEEIEMKKKEKLIKENLLVVGCARLGSKDAVIQVGAWKDIKQCDFGKPPYCLIVPANKLHFLEKEMLEFYAFKSTAKSRK